MKVVLSIVLFVAVGLARAATDPECSSYDHANYGCVGECVATSACPGGKYISNLCPSQASNVKCCFTVDSDDECAEYDHSTYGQVGHCIDSSQCPYSNYISNLCPTKASSVKCCFSKPSGTCGGGGGSCGSTVQSLACEVLALHNAGSIYLLTDNGVLNPSGSGDGADSYSNIVDTCNGYTALRSSYCCSSGCTPGGSTCLSQTLLEYIIDLADDGHYLQINAIAGACHSTNSYHYRGTAVDFQIFSSSSYSQWMSKCSAYGAVENLGPGYPGHSTHTHCAFYS
ncbi:uncharacterized protein [Diadema antillarum]|uniref:uncharacterized protein n=1 Tax=Diadema antillarum TaxID=105358 RepID=UPI003A87AA26